MLSYLTSAYQWLSSALYRGYCATRDVLKRTYHRARMYLATLFLGE